MLSDRINDLIIAFTQMRQQPGLNKKAINKTIARLEEAQLWSTQIVTLDAAADRQSLDQTAPGCICPPGTKSKDCPVHANVS